MKKVHNNLSILSILSIVVFLFSISPLKAQTPEINILKVNRIFDNGEHNAFTDMHCFNGYIYLAFRSCPDGHGVSPNSSIIVLRSKDGKEWKEVNRFSVKYRDTRDPHFLLFKDKLFIYTGTWFYGDIEVEKKKFKINEHLGYAVWTENGNDWRKPEMLEETYGHYIWRAASYNGKAYLCGRRNFEFSDVYPNRTDDKYIESAMLESDDGLIWKKKTLFQEKNGDETAFIFEPTGTVLAVARRSGNNAELCTSEFPWNKWDRTDLGEYIGGPLLVKWGKRYLVGGRKRTDNGYKTALSWLIDKKLYPIVKFPSGGDNSYPSFIEINENHALISYYSSHENYENGKPMTSIYMAEIIIEK